MVRFENVQKSYDGETLVVKNLNLDIAKGEFLTLLGPSGSGKTTSLMMLAGFEPATHGEIFLNGKPINDVPPHKRGIGMVFQNYALFPHMTVAENLAFPLVVRKMSKADVEAKVRRALDMVKLRGFEARKPGQLSGGQQQRVAVARALVFEPDLVLMDEPLGALDKQLREQMQFEIKHIHESLGVTVVYVTHDQTEALTMSDRIAVFNNGRIEQVGAPVDMYERPTTEFVAKFVGTTNVIDGILAQTMFGIDATFSVRPERARLVDANYATAPDEITAAATIRDVHYLGNTTRVHLIIDDPSLAAPLPFIVEQPPHSAPSLRDNLTRGTSCIIAFDRIPRGRRSEAGGLVAPRSLRRCASARAQPH